MNTKDGNAVDPADLRVGYLQSNAPAANPPRDLEDNGLPEGGKGHDKGLDESVIGSHNRKNGRG